MKSLFVAIRNNDIEKVQSLIEKKPELVNCVAKQPPKKDDGQSPLQVAFKTEGLEIADYLISMGADVNFIEDESCANSWRQPVIHDAINCAIMCSRYNTYDDDELEVYNTKEWFEQSFELLKKLVELGADVNALDSYGNNCLFRACIQAAQILPSFNYSTKEIYDDRLITPELTEDLTKVFDLLIDNGADVNYKNSNGTIFDLYNGHPVLDFIKK